MAFTYVVFHKPLDVLSQFTDASGRSTLADYIPLSGIYPVGRLDYDSEGLMLLTDHAELQHRVSHPRFKQNKTYLAQVEGEPSAAALQQLLQGVELSNRTHRAVAVRQVEPQVPPRARPIRYRKSIPTAWLEIVLNEGINRQVRRMTAAVGLPTLRLIRIGVGPLKLDLESGQWRHLRADELRELLSATGLSLQHKREM